MSANYTLSYVERDGNPHEVQAFGDDLKAALDERSRRERACVNKRAQSIRRQVGTAWTWTQVWNWARSDVRLTIHWMVHDAEDPERGYFDSLEDVA